MATKLRSRVRPTISRAAAITNLDNVKFLVNERGLRCKSHASNRTIVFDREVASGIFAPAAPVPDDLAEEYRSVGGNLGVMVYGSLEREMTLAEIRSLQPDDPETVERDMRSIATQHPGRVFYDVGRVAWAHRMR
jgi:hypothetical protein